jgi:hypothetical protein
MPVPAQTSSAFPSPYEVETPPGCEGWQEMYPYYTLFHDARREADESRFWFWNGGSALSPSNAGIGTGKCMEFLTQTRLSSASRRASWNSV